MSILPGVSDLFSDAARGQLKDVAPLATRLRPRRLGDFVGQEHVVAPGSALALAIEAAQVQPWPQLDLAQTIAVLPFVWLAVRLFEPTEIATARVARAELEA